MPRKKYEPEPQTNYAASQPSDMILHVWILKLDIEAETGKTMFVTKQTCGDKDVNAVHFVEPELEFVMLLLLCLSRVLKKNQVNFKLCCSA